MNSGKATPEDNGTLKDVDELPGTDVEEWIKQRKGAPVVTPGVPAPGSEQEPTTNAIEVRAFDRTLDAETIGKLQDMLVVCTEAIHVLDTIMRNSKNDAETALLKDKRTVFFAQQKAINALLGRITSITFRVVPNEHIRVGITYEGVEYHFT